MDLQMYILFAYFVISSPLIELNIVQRDITFCVNCQISFPDNNKNEPVKFMEKRITCIM